MGGLAQGSLLSPYLFDLYLNDLLVELEMLDLRIWVAYADDIILATENIEKMEIALNQVESFCNKRYLKLNK